MSGAVFSRLKNWAIEVLTNTDLNQEIDNILSHLDPTGVGDYSDTAAMMKLTTNPGTTGAEVLATSLAGELERLRYVIKRILGSGVTNWYDPSSTSLTDLLNSIGSQNLAVRIVSGRTTGNSSQLCALIPSSATGTAAAIVLSASVTPFVYAVGGINYTASANVTFSGLTLQAANQTAQLTDFYAGITDTPASSRGHGMYGTKLRMTSPATAVVSSVGSFQAFKQNTEVMLAYVESTGALSSCWRSAFFDTAATLMPAVAYSSLAPVSLLKTAWIFFNTSGSIAVTYTNPTVGPQPTSPNANDYWFDVSTTAWKSYSGSAWNLSNSVLIGVCGQDTASCIAARTFDSYVSPSGENTCVLEMSGFPGTAAGSTIVDRGPNSFVNVFGTKINLGPSKLQWTTTTLDSNVTLAASMPYFLYLKETGIPVVSDKFPLQRRELGGFYHPAETWRALGMVRTDSNTFFTTPIRNLRGVTEQMQLLESWAYYNLTAGMSNQNKFQGMYPGRYVNDLHGTSAFTQVQAAWMNVATITVTPGLWALSANAIMGLETGTAGGTAWNTTAGSNIFWMGISTDSGTATMSDIQFAANAVQAGFSNGVMGGSATAFYTTLVINDYLVAVETAAVTYYLKTRVEATANASFGHKATQLSARRLDDLIGAGA